MNDGEAKGETNGREEPEAQDITYELKSVTEAANLLQISESTVWRYVAQDILPAYRVGKKRVMFRPSDLDGLLGRVRRKRKEPMAANKALRLFAMSDGARFSGDAMARAVEVRERILANRAGAFVTASWEDINEAREERTADL